MPRDWPPRVWKLWSATTDSAADAKAARRRVARELEANLSALWTEVDCFNHQYASLRAFLLVIMDEILVALEIDQHVSKFYSAVAKLVHSWREKPSEMFNVFLRFGAGVAAHCAGTVPPAPLAGRWHRMRELEDFLVAIMDYSEEAEMWLEAVLIEVLTKAAETADETMEKMKAAEERKKAARAKAAAAPSRAAPADEGDIRSDEMKAFECTLRANLYTPF